MIKKPSSALYQLPLTCERNILRRTAETRQRQQGLYLEQGIDDKGKPNNMSRYWKSSFITI